MYRLVAALLFAVFVPLVGVHAQNFTNVDPLTLTITPTNPRPYQTISVTPKSSSIDLISAKTRVTVNGRVVADTAGVQTVPITVGGPGEATTIRVTATVDGQSYIKEITIRPADVALVVDPVATSQPFYEGALLTPVQGRVRIIAMPDVRTNGSTRIPPQNLVYTWKLGDRILTEQSGLGRYILTATAPVRYRDAQVTVTVTSPSDPNLVASAATAISPKDPVIRFYEESPLLGPIFERALSGTFTMLADEESVRGVSYFFAAQPTLKWAVNGQQSGGDTSVTLRASGGGGSATLSLNAALASTNQSSDGKLTVKFGGSKSNNIFGF